ncbi:MAG: flagellar basal-body protein FlbY [Oceanicaulis sp.]|uniref:flagellar basal-body protein FlbY n=1 Tax=Glycocaulis sp. TaxID=1969725 RepID=UPI0025C6D195|nr:flagellar basal-body protein FlbY [Glycocaulis sp.]MCC5981317.1 flagellar basal-body protein FlbY [Oceanicaulis sp.]MCH8520432.1 flagellar basal-body protein FlbY [Glycocaulis sp.]
MSELAAKSPTERAEHLIRLVKRLTELFETETAYFEARQPHKAFDLQDEKMQLANIYRRESQLAAGDPERLSGLDESLRTRLREHVERLEAAVQKNGIVVEALKTLTEGLVKAIADEAARQRSAEAGYGPDAARSARIGAIACNQTA